MKCIQLQSEEQVRW